MKPQMISSLIGFFSASTIYGVIFFSSSQYALAYSISGFCSGGRFSCAVIDSDQAKCWGQSRAFGYSTASYEALGDEVDEIGDMIPFIDFDSSTSVEEIFCGGQHVCAKLVSGDIKCIGYNNYGQIGLGVSTTVIGSATSYMGSSLPALSLSSSLTVESISLGKQHSCAKFTTGEIKCWGYGGLGLPGRGNTNNIGASSGQMGDSLPIMNLGTGVQVSLIKSGPASDHSCVILSAPGGSADRIKCWGQNNYYQLGYGTALGTGARGDGVNEMGDYLPLVDLGTESRVSQIALGAIHTCTLLIDGVLKCFGYGAFGNLGSGASSTVSATGNSLPAVVYDSGSTIYSIQAGEYHNCVLYQDATTVKCFGSNDEGQLGQEDTTDRGDTPSTTIDQIPAIDFAAVDDIEFISVGNNFNCVGFVDNTIKCFGYNYDGQLAIGNYESMGDEEDEMGGDLPFSYLASSSAPTKQPTAPTPPTAAPSKAPTKKPTTKSPTIKPTTKSPTTKSPTKVPTTKSPTVAPTPKVSTVTGKYIIRFDQGSLNYTQAEEACQLLYGTHLPTFNSFSEVYEVFAYGDYNDYWVGLNDIAVEGTYIWVSGSSSAYRTWATSEPTGIESEDCISASGVNGKWSDVNCGLTYNILVCDSPPTDSPTSTPTA